MKNTKNELPDAGHGQWENLARTYTEFDQVNEPFLIILKRNVNVSWGGLWPTVGIVLLVTVFIIFQMAT